MNWLKRSLARLRSACPKKRDWSIYPVLQIRVASSSGSLKSGGSAMATLAPDFILCLSDSGPERTAGITCDVGANGSQTLLLRFCGIQ
jgi:hypothetical protein